MIDVGQVFFPEDVRDQDIDRKVGTVLLRVGLGGGGRGIISGVARGRSPSPPRLDARFVVSHL